jgi:hypothetical protein
MHHLSGLNILCKTTKQRKFREKKWRFLDSGIVKIYDELDL